MKGTVMEMIVKMNRRNASAGEPRRTPQKGIHNHTNACHFHYTHSPLGIRLDNALFPLSLRESPQLGKKYKFAHERAALPFSQLQI